MLDHVNQNELDETKENVPAAEESTPVTEENTPVAEEAAPKAEETAPAAEEAVPKVEEPVPAAEEKAPASDTAEADDISMYYPDGDAEHMADDDNAEKSSFNGAEEAKPKNKKHDKGLTKGQIALIVVCSVLALLLLAGAWIAFYKPAQPGQEEIPFDTTPITPDDPDESDTQPVEPDEAETAKKDDGYVAQQGQYNILVVGHDRTALLADVTMIVNINADDNSISVVQIPRDTFVSLNIATNKINALYATLLNQEYIDGAEKPAVAAMRDYAEVLEKSLCLKIHHTVVMDLDGFQQIVDAIDGVDVYVQENMYYYDPWQNLSIEIPAGWQHLDGYNAEGFVRYRYGLVQADIGRGDSQKIFMTAFFNKVKATVKSLDAGKLANLAEAVINNVDTDMSVADLIYYAKFALKVDLENVTMMTMPGTTADVYYVLNRAAALNVVNEYFNIYDKPITDSIFDRNYLFCMTDWQTLSNVYFAPAEYYTDHVYSGDQIDDNELYIQFVH